MKPFEAYQTFITLKAHFKNSGFDYHRFGKVKVAPETFERRKDRYYFEKLAKRYSREEIVEFFLSQILANKNWVGDMLGEDAEEAHLSRLKRVQSLQYHIKGEINNFSWECNLHTISESQTETHFIIILRIPQFHILFFVCKVST